MILSPDLVDCRPITIRRAATAAWRPTADLRELSRYGDLFRTLTEHRIRVRYKQSVLGFAWAILQPLSMMLIFTLVFGRIARVPTGGIPYALFAFSGVLLWSFVSTSLSNATHALVANAPLVTKVYFPREVLPLSYVAAALFDLLVGSGVLLALLAWYGRPVTLHLALAIPVVALTAVITTAIAFILASLQVRFRDIGLALPLVLYLWMFCTPVAYPLAAVPGRYQRFFALNPLTGIIESFRHIVLEQGPLSPASLGGPLVAAALLLPVAYWLFKRTEATMADVI